MPRYFGDDGVINGNEWGADIGANGDAANDGSNALTCNGACGAVIMGTAARADDNDADKININGDKFIFRCYQSGGISGWALGDDPKRLLA